MQRIITPLRLFLTLSVFAWFAAPAHADDLAPDFSLPTTNGNVQLKDLRGHVVYVDFWASWCPPCRKSFPWMNDMHKRYGKQGFDIVAINLDKKRDLANTFLQKIPARFTVAFDPEGKVADLYQPRGMPTAYLIDKQGHIHTTHLGFREKDTPELEAMIKALLAK